MCGIIGYTGQDKVRDILIDGLLKLEYRGYDSAGIAIHNGNLRIIKSPGKVKNLVNQLPQDLDATTGIAHTRWATHGEPNETNAHPHLSHDGKLVLVHNGIIENSEEIESQLKKKGYVFKSETDTEILLNLIEDEYKKYGNDLMIALISVFRQIEGSFALAIIERDKPGRITMCRKDSPLVLGIGSRGYYIASDIYAVSEYTTEFVFPDDKDIIVADKENGIMVFNETGEIKQANIKSFTGIKRSVDISGYDHFMIKEIAEQPDIINSLVNSQMSVEGHSQSNEDFDSVLKRIRRITILGCGTSWHAGLIGKYMIEKHVRIPVNVEYASEYRYRHPVIEIDDLVISISQSGETADTIAGNRLAVDAGAVTMGLINTRNTSLVRDTDFQLYLEAGDEIGVASTKAYTAQIVQLLRLTSYMAALNGNPFVAKDMEKAFHSLNGKLQRYLDNENGISDLAAKYAFSNNFLFLGRGINFPTALEGALKLKEISYIHAEGYPGAEMKHGPIALIDINFPTLVVLTDQESKAKMKANIKEIKARKGKVIALITENDSSSASLVDDVIRVPEVPDIVSPLISIIPLQLFAYHVALLRGCNVDQPRNLAKSVTVE